MTTVRRIHFEGATQIVRLAGAQGLPLFADEDDAFGFDALLARAVDRFNARVFAASLLPHTVEMVIESGDEPLSRLMQQLMTGYTRQVNARHGKSGHLFAGRYKTVLIDPSAYLPEAIRQVHLLPVHAGLVRDPQQFLWSGHRALLGLAEKPWLDRATILRVFHAVEDRAVSVYRAFVSRGSTSGRRLMDSDAARDGILGNSAFRQSLEERQKGGRPLRPRMTLVQVFAAASRLFDVEITDLMASGRNHALGIARHAAARAAVDTGVATLSDIAAFTGRDVSTLSRNIARFEIRLAEDPALSQILNTLTRQIEETGYAPD